MRRTIRSKLSSLFLYNRILFFSSPFSGSIHHYHHLQTRTSKLLGRQILCNGVKNDIPSMPPSIFSYFVAQMALSSSSQVINADDDATDEVEPIDLWEEGDEFEPEIADGGDGAGAVLQNCAWGERVLSIAQEVLLQFNDDLKLYAFKTIPRGMGCPSMEEMESFSKQYKTKLDEVGATGDIPNDLPLEVSSHGAERLLKVPDDLHRFKDLALRVDYVEHLDTRSPIKNGVFMLESVEIESGY